MSNPYEVQAAAAYTWWARLTGNDTDRLVPGDRAAIARLKRASSVMEAAAEPATGDLFRQLGYKRADAVQHLPRAAVLAAVLAHVTERRPEKLGRVIGVQRGGDGVKPLISPLRLKRILAARELDEVLIQFRRTIAIAGRQANVRDLAVLVLAWTDGAHGDLTRTHFAFDYHDADRFAPPTNIEQDQANTL